MKSKSGLFKIVVSLLVLVVLGVGMVKFVLPQKKVTSNNNDNSNDDLAVSSLLVQLSKEDIIARANLIIEGTVVKQSDEFLIEPADSLPPLAYREFTVKIDEDYRNSVGAKDTVKVLIPGGKFDGKVYNVEDGNFDFKSGDKYLLFLNKRDVGGAYNVKGDYFYIVGESQGIFDIKDKPLYRLINSDLEIKLSDLLNKSNKENSSYSNIHEELLDDRLEEGNMSEEEFQNNVDNLKDYAKIIRK